MAGPPARKKLLVILGAGSSVGLGMPSVTDLDRLMRGWASDWSTRLSWPDCYKAVDEAMASYALAGQATPRPNPTFETALGAMAHLSHWLTPPPLGASLRGLVGLGDPRIAFPNPEGFGPSHLVEEQLRHLLAALAQDLRARSRAIDTAGATMARYRRLFDGLKATFDLGVFNLNYDAVALQAWPDAETGFSGGAFAPESVHGRDHWGFVYHLHGSVHHDLADTGTARIVWRNDLAGEFQDGLQSLLGDERSEGRNFPRSTLIAGGLKLDQLLAEPFYSLHAALVRCAYEADAVLVGGYGFADVHVNRALRNRLAALALPDRPPVMVLDWARSGTVGMAGRMDAWSRDLSRTLVAPGSLFTDPNDHGWPQPEALAKAGRFEISPTHRTAIWHGGFLAAADHVDRIASWLSGRPGDLDP